MILETLSATAGQKLFKVVVADACKAVSSTLATKVKQWNTETRITALYKKIGNVRRVKTIWQVDKAVDLTSFYCDSRVIINGCRKVVEQVADFGSNDNLLVEGIAGQGKSIFLRYLCAVALAQGQCIPVFVELRKISQSQTLQERIDAELSNLGLSVDQPTFDALAQSGKITLFLDAFDEIPEKEKKRTLAEIEDLASRHEMLRIIATSRPHHAIAMSSHFTNVKLDNLQDDEYKQVIHTLSKGDAWADSLIEHIDKRAQHIRALLCTPLMVTLLVLTYKSHKQLPNRLAGFYDSLFFTLLQRHDGTKPGFTRHRACALDDEQYRQVFEAICIVSKENPVGVFTYNDFYKITERALDEVQLHESAASYLADIITITCLIVHDGDEHRFIHKTVQEYYAAAFIAKKPDVWARKFYQRVASVNSFLRWREELFFLREIDRYRHDRYFMLPTILTYIGATESDLDGIAKPLAVGRVEKMLEPYTFGFGGRATGSRLASLRVSGSHLFEDRLVGGFCDLDYACVLQAVENKQVAARAMSGSRKEKIQEVSALAVFRAGIMKEELGNIVERVAGTLFSEAKAIKQKLAADDGDKILTGLI